MSPTQAQSKTEERRKHKLLKKVRKQEKLLKLAKKCNEEKNAPPDKDKLAEDDKISLSLIELPTVSIAVPGTILENAQSQELRTYLAGQIARASCIYRIDEIIVFDDICVGDETKCETVQEADGIKMTRRSCTQLARILQYLECPQYLRRFFFPLHKDLEYAGLVNPLDAPHHLRKDEDFPFREGVTVKRPGKPGRCVVNVGLQRDVIADRALLPGLRVTVRLLPPSHKEAKRTRAAIVSPVTPRAETGVYWGYTVRVASSLSAVFTQCPFEGGYDLTIGTSDKGTPASQLKRKQLSGYRHALIVFGGLQGLEAALENDEQLNVEQPSLLFDHYVNTCPSQGTRTLRTEEALLISLAVLQKKLKTKAVPVQSQAVAAEEETNEEVMQIEQ
ncbi:putative methyltransferase C9orf114 isoform X1 [Schistocerca nitens]|uniref:putative methyltransferase C9orf114 isoform X1 n=1 Tax=Schistocerca nitens TaxID=7011 RepID=UPI0021185BF5|nr:putative methyltransferase C9orf114 isoform X1 [Schistocerca nitens]